MFVRAFSRSIVRVGVAALCLALLGACGEENGRAGDPGVLRLSVLPAQDDAALERRHRPLINYLQQETGYTLELMIAESYDDLSRSFAAGNTDVAWFGGLTFVRAAHANGAEPLVMRDVDTRFVSHFIVRSSTPGETLEDFRGKRMAFGPMLSTSGHLMPRYYLVQRGIEAVEFFSELEYTAGHDDTVRRLLDGHVEIGAVNSEIVESMFEDGRLSHGAIRVLEITPPYANYVWAVQSSMNAEVRDRLMQAFLRLDFVDPGHRAILSLQGAGGFMPAAPEDFIPTAEAAVQLGLMGEAL